MVKTKIVHDRFRIIQMFSHGVDKVRRAGHKALKSDGHNTLTGTPFI